MSHNRPAHLVNTVLKLMVPEIVIVRLVMQESIVRFLNWIPELIVQMDIIHRKEK